MKQFFIFWAAFLMFNTSGLYAQTTDTKDVQIAKRKLRVGADTSLYVTSTTNTITSTSTHRQMPTAKSVYDYGLSIDEISDFISTGLGNPPAAAASDNDAETWRNMTTGELWRSDGTLWSLFLSGQMGADTNQVLKWNGAEWYAANDSTGGGATDAIGTGFTAGGGNGTIPDSTKATLGGLFTIENLGANVMRIGDVGNVNGGYGITVDGGAGSVTLGNNWAGGDAYLILTGDANYLRTDGSNLQQTASSTTWNILSGAFSFTDDRATKVGLQYSADYSAAFTDRSLVDKAYVDNTDGNGIYGGDGSIPNGTQATLVNNGFFAFEWHGGNDAISIDDFGEQMVFRSPNGSQIIQFNNAGIELNGGGTILNVSGTEAKLAGETIIYTVPTPTIDPDAALDVQSTTKLLYPPRMTTVQRDAISTGGLNNGGVLYNITTGKLTVRDGTGWVELGAGPASATVTNYTADGTFTVNGAKSITVICVGGGGGGGSGRKGAVSSQRYGGGGGAAGAVSTGHFSIAELGDPATITVTVGAAGGGGASVSASSTNGNTGTAGGNSSVSVSGTTFLNAYGGSAGAGGTSANGTGGSIPTSGDFFGQAGGNGSNNAAAGTPADTGNKCGGSGGGGSGINSSNALGTSGAGGKGYYILANGGAGGGAGLSGANGTAPALDQLTGGGGGGGGSSTSANSGNGGNGARGGGGGGGGASVDSVGDSGAGGTGGAGYVRIIAHY